MSSHIITNIKSKDFMGHSIDEPIGQKTVFTGCNTAGKSMRANIIAITAMGFSPFSTKTSKKPSDILNDFGNGQKMVTEFTCGGVVFERKFTRSEKGSVSNIMRVNKTRASKADFQLELFKAGNPQIIDLGAFIKLSDNEKINTLFSLYPTGTDLSNLNSEIDQSKKKISRLNESINATKAATRKLTESKSEIKMPAGTFAENKASIANLTSGILEAKEALRIAEEKNAEELRKSIPEGPSTQDRLDKRMEENTVSFRPDNSTISNHLENNMNSNHVETNMYSSESIRESIQRIITTMGKADCSICAAGLVAKAELNKYKGGAK